MTKYQNVIQSAERQFLVRCMSSIFNLYVVNEYPKSGGSWLSQMLAEAIGVPFPRDGAPVWGSSIMQGHFLNGFGIRNAVVLWRDGRDVMVSWYYHCLFPNDRNNRRLVDIVRGDLMFEDYSDVFINLPVFIEYCFTAQKHPRYSWSCFVEKWARKSNIVQIRYEDLRANTAEELIRVTRLLSGKIIPYEVALNIVEKYSFSKLSERTAGAENINSFMRKGVVGDWRLKFSRESRQIFNAYAGSALIELGYERDSIWVNDGL